MSTNSLQHLCNLLAKTSQNTTQTVARTAPKTVIQKGWAPKRKLDRPAMDLLRQLYSHNPTKEMRVELAEKFGISYEAVKIVTVVLELGGCLAWVRRQETRSPYRMDLSVLQGPDPAGYKAEEAFRNKEREDEARNSGKDSNRRVTGSIAGADSSQFHQYRKTRREEIERLERFQKQTEEELANEDFYQKREEAKRKLAEKTEKNRAKRLKKAAKKKKDS